METLSHLIALFVLVWGVIYGIPNYLTRLVSIITNSCYEQGMLGKVIDFIWVLGVIYLVYIQYWELL